MSNEDLIKAKNAKKDEFYTQRPDIENELKHYTEHFKGKTVFCNCDTTTLKLASKRNEIIFADKIRTKERSI